MLGHKPQRQLAQGRQVRVLEEVLSGAGGAALHVYLALAQALAKRLRRDVDQLDLVRQPEHGVRNGLVHRGARDLPHGVGAALDVLDVEGRVHVDTRVEQLDDVLVALRMARSRGVRVRKLVHQHELRLALEYRLQVHLGE